MENCLIIINKSAGTSDKISFDSVKKRLGNNYQYSCHTIPTDGEPKLVGYDALAVCGGDGTLSNVLSQVYDKPQDVFYFPAGTLNDKAKANKIAHSPHAKSSAKDNTLRHAVVGIITKSDSAHGKQNTVFSYVCAAGSFTPIGYTTSVKMKKKFGVLAYLAEVIKEYKPHKINASITLDGKNKYLGDFTLVMLLKSPRCFGFKFNKAYDEESESGHIILIRSPKHRGLLGKIEMFFPFFRVFFAGLKNEREGKIVFKEFHTADIQLHSPTDFCKDGEKETIKDDFKVDFLKTECNLNLVDKY